MLFTGYTFAQCPINEVEIKVNIATDNWGYETSWTLTDLLGTIIMQGGQGGAYQNNSSYSDSTCVLADGCFFFEIYDTFGDGIHSPNGYQLYVDEILVSSGANEIGNYAKVFASCPNPCGLTLNALNDFQGHLNGTINLTTNELTLIKNTFDLFPECLAESEAMILLGKAVVEDFDNLVGPLFTTFNTEYGFSKNPAISPGLEVERAMVALQQGIFDYVFTANVYSDYLKRYRKTDRVIDISALSEGMYILQVELAGGVQINKRVLVLR